MTFFPKYPITAAAMDKGLIEGPDADTSSNKWLMFYREERPRDIQSLYFLIAATQHASVEREFIRKALKDEDLLNQPKKLFHLLDEMIQEKDYVHDYRKREKNLEFLEGIEKALIIPSSEVSTLSNIFEILSEKYPDCHWTLLTGEFSRKYWAILPPEKIRAFARGERHSLEVTSYRDNHSRWKLFGIDWEWIRQLREKKFDLAVLIHDNKEGRGYIHVELVAMMSGAKRILIFKPDRSAVRLDPFPFVRTALERKIGHPK